MPGWAILLNVWTPDPCGGFFCGRVFALSEDDNLGPEYGSFDFCKVPLVKALSLSETVR